MAHDELVPRPQRSYLPAETAVALFAGAPPVDLARLRDDLDALADQGLDPRA